MIAKEKCNVCGNTVELLPSESLRENVCPICSAVKRTRDLARVIIETFLGNDLSLSEAVYNLKNLYIYEAQSNGPIHNILKQLQNYTCSEYFDNVPTGSINKSGIRCEDLQKLTFQDNTFDLIITQDVLEHVANQEKAFSEINRVLKPDGVHIFTVPLHEGRKTVKRAIFNNQGNLENLLPQIYHDDSLRREGSLVYTDFGDDLIDILRLKNIPTEKALYSKFYDIEKTPDVDTKEGYENYSQCFKEKNLLKYFKYNSVVFRSKKSMSKILEITGERFIPWMEGAQIHYEHFHRYAFVAQFVKGKRVLDMACGEGYGSNMLSKEAEYVVGIDIDENTVNHARCKYNAINLEFIKASILEIPIQKNEQFDVIVCFEGLEHIEEHEQFLSEVKRLLKKDGLFIVSTPNKKIYTDEPSFNNPFHKKELYFQDFNNLIKNYFKNSLFFGQKVYGSSNIWPLTPYDHPGYKEFVIEKNDKVFNFSEPGKKNPLYFIAIASDKTLNQKLLDNSSLIDASDSLIKDFQKQISELFGTIHAKDTAIHAKDTAIQAKDTAIQAKDTAIQAKNAQITNLNNVIQTKDAQITNLNTALNSIHQSITWQVLMKYHTVMEKLLPPGTKRRGWYDLNIQRLRIIAKEGFKPVFFKVKHCLTKQKIKISKSGSQTKEQYILDSFNRASHKSPEYVPLSQDPINLTEDDIKLVTFYLPQYHPIPENDKFWGKGFTDWRNVAKAVPQFIGHYQPRLPDELGFYDLRLFEVLKRQIELAQQYGIYGFCFHYYWFNGKKLLEKPLEQFLNHPELNFKFCVCWANENWTRRWDGLENEILIAQAHSIENDIAFIKDIEPLFRDPRYMRINGKPILIVYRVTLLPDAKITAERWREYCRQYGIGEIYLIAAQSFNFTDPRPYGFDAAVEFPPHNNSCGNINDKIRFLNKNFSGNIYDFKDYIKSRISIKTTPYKLFKTVFPSWDNTARKPNNASLFYGSNPEIYKEWLSNVVNFTRKVHAKEERIVFINAWNEWAEGAYLEPDTKYGYGNLQSTSEVVLDYRRGKVINKKIIFVSHDAFHAGAQMLSINIIKILKELFHYEIYLILKSGGRLEDEFKKYSNVYNLEKDFNSPETLNELIHTLHNKGAEIAICNTVVSGDLIELFHKQNIQTLSLIHELPGLIKQYNMEKNANIIAQYADRIIFPSEFVKSKFTTVAELDENKCVIAPQGLYLRNNFKDKKEVARIKLRELLSIPQDSKIVLAVGLVYFRKGADLFVQVAKNVVQTDQNTYFIWVGHRDKNFMKEVSSEIKKARLENNIRFVGIQKDVDLFYAGSDVYLMTSREDPFPSTILESMDVEVPVIGFEDAGGFKEVINENTGILVPYLDVNAMTNAVVSLQNDTKLRNDLGKNSSELIRREYNFIDYVYLLLKLLGNEYRKVSVVVPNYNYERYLDGRFKSIIDQTYPVSEIIFLDDHSSDKSIDVAKNFAENCTIPIKIISNDSNSGSVSKQWAKGIAAARGEYIWIAEADDLSERSFLQEVIAGFDDENVVLSYSQSKQIDQNGNIIEEDYSKYTNEIDGNKWNEKYSRDGIQEICDTLAIKNTIPNVSAVVFKKYDVLEILNELVQFKVAGDWFFYVWLLQKGKISFNPESLNCHRRHDKGVTISENARRHFDEIVRMQEYIKERFDISDITLKKVLAYRSQVRDYLL